MKYNKGEWSEAYLIIKILEDGQINSGDELGNLVPEIFYPITKIIDYDNDIEYLINHSDNYLTESVDILDFEGNLIKEDITPYELSNISSKSLKTIKDGKKTFEVEILE